MLKITKHEINTKLLHLYKKHMANGLEECAFSTTEGWDMELGVKDNKK